MKFCTIVQNFGDSWVVCNMRQRLFQDGFREFGPWKGAVFARIKVIGDQAIVFSTEAENLKSIQIRENSFAINRGRLEAISAKFFSTSSGSYKRQDQLHVDLDHTSVGRQVW